MKIIRRFMFPLLLLIILISSWACGKKTPLFFKDRADSSMTMGYADKEKLGNK